MTPVDPIEALLADTDLMWSAVLSTIDGLTTEEYLWEPVPGCWSIRPSTDGGFVQDWMPVPAVEPFTTIGWRLAHIGQSLAVHAQRLFQQGSFSYASYRPAGSVDGERGFAEKGFARWRAGIATRGERLTPELAAEILSYNHHHLGHAKEIDAIRQLYRAQAPRHEDPFVAACLLGDLVTAARHLDGEDARRLAIDEHPDLVALVAAMGHWGVVTLLLEHGWPADGPRGATALHHAAAAGTPELVRALLERGADPQRQDLEWKATPRGWAEYFSNTATLEALPGG